VDVDDPRPPLRVAAHIAHQFPKRLDRNLDQRLLAAHGHDATSLLCRTLRTEDLGEGGAPHLELAFVGLARAERALELMARAA
jgi:hypothetical protein